MNEDFIRGIFTEFDGDKDGILTRLEAESAAKNFGITDVKNFLKQFRHQPDGSYAIDEIAGKIKKMWVEEMNTEAFTKLFNHIDRDKSGALDLSEIKSMLDVFGIEVSNEELHEFFTSADVNNDGQIDTKEYIGFLRRLFSRQRGPMSNKAKAGQSLRSSTASTSDAASPSQTTYLAPSHSSTI